MNASGVIGAGIGALGNARQACPRGLALYAIARMVLGSQMSRRVVAALLIAVTAASCAAPVTSSTRPGPSAVAGALPSEEQRHEAGAVTVAVSWISGTSSARVAMDTHSVDLDGFDLKELARVRLDGGAWVIPTAWDAPRGGHHRSGTLTFGSVEPHVLAGARVIELEVRDVGAPSHLLRWGPTP
jgi:hypothetical protein